MHKKLFPILFIFLISFLTISSVKAEGYFTVDGNTGNYLTCTYGTNGDAYMASLVFKYDGNEVSYEAGVGQGTEEANMDRKKGNSYLKNASGILKGVKESGKCPTGSVMLVKISEIGTAMGAGGESNKNRQYHLWLGYKEATLEKYKSENCDKECKSVDSTSCCVYGKLQKSDVSDSLEEAQKDGEKARDDVYFQERFKKEADESVIDKEVVLSDDVCGIIKGDIADILHDIVWFIFIAGVLLAVILGMVDFIGSVVSAKDDSMKKAWGRFIKRIVAVAILLLLPVVLEFLLTQINVDGISDGDIFCNVDVN